MKDILKHSSIEDAVKSFAGFGVSIEEKTYVTGGDINESYMLKLSDGTKCFLKRNTRKGEDFFRAEMLGLMAIADTQTISCPRIHSYGKDGNGSFLLCEYIEAAPKVSDFWEFFAEELAALHKADTAKYVREGNYGFSEDNYIGATVQYNGGHDSWVGFFRDERLKPQIEMADRFLLSSDKKDFDKLLEKLDDILVEPEHPSLLHGDLWGGNFVTGSDGKAWLIDPATYVGCAEADIAMTELFGGFSRSFYQTYKECGCLMPGYEDRKEIYNLYHLLNHLNLFGSSYLSSVRNIIKRRV
ncbi:MAG: fructosamine kinase family protein [Eubacterium sp.]|nr:fructosamine kinase family protein [Eubacterium sp.]